MSETKEVKRTAPVAQYTKAQVLQAKRFSNAEKDVFSAILTDDSSYSLDDLNKALADFNRKEVRE